MAQAGRPVSLEERIRRMLVEVPRRQIEDPCPGQAAVLIPILEVETRPRLLLTRRTRSVGTHKGQISFPGGLQEPSDASLLQTALRETAEELGLTSRQIDVAGAFHEYRSITGWRVVPFVGFVRGALALHPNRAEVAKVLEIPLEFFQQAHPRREEHRKLGRLTPVYFYDYRGEVIWGLTAAMILDLVAIL